MVKLALNKIRASVVIPVYNQYSSLMLCLQFFKKQQIQLDTFEIIIVDDGSTDELQTAIETDPPFATLPYTIKIVHQQNMGRAQARNTGVLHSRADCIIFSDGDRIPHPTFVKKHLLFHQKNKNGVVFGCPKDYFGKINLISMDNYIASVVLEKYSRIPVYYKKIVQLFNESGSTESELSWVTFLVGNASVTRDMFNLVEGFDPDFQEWGFEHYDFALRLLGQNILIHHWRDIINYHLPHRRVNDFYRDMIRRSITILREKHPDKKIELLEEFLFGKLSLQEFEQYYGGQVSNIIRDREPIFYRNI